MIIDKEERACQEMILMLNNTSEGFNNWMEKAIFGYTHEKLFEEIIEDLQNDETNK